MEVLAAVHGRTAKGLTQLYQRIFRLEQLGLGFVTPMGDPALYNADGSLFVPEKTFDTNDEEKDNK